MAHLQQGLGPSRRFGSDVMDDTRDILLFSYGTLQLESVQRSSFGRRLDGEPDAMTGYARTMVEITDPAVLAASGERFHPIVSPSSDPSDEVAGTVFRISAEELAAAPGPRRRLPSASKGPSNPYSRCGRWPRPAQRSSPSTPPIRLTESNTCSATPRCCSG